MQRRRRSPSSLLVGIAHAGTGPEGSCPWSFLRPRRIGCAWFSARGRPPPSRGQALAHAGGSTLTGAFVVPGAQAGPRDQMTFGREAVHVDADLRNDDLGAQIADAGDGAQDLDRGAKGLDMGVDLLIDLTDSGVDRIDMLKEQP